MRLSRQTLIFKFFKGFTRILAGRSWRGPRGLGEGTLTLVIGVEMKYEILSKSTQCGSVIQRIYIEDVDIFVDYWNPRLDLEQNIVKFWEIALDSEFDSSDSCVLGWVNTGVYRVLGTEQDQFSEETSAES